MSDRNVQSVPAIVVNLDLTNARAAVEIIPPGRRLTQYVVTQMVNGGNLASVALSVSEGPEGQPIAMQPNFSHTFPLGFSRGLYATNAAQPGSSVQLLVVPAVDT